MWFLKEELAIIWGGDYLFNFPTILASMVHLVRLEIMGKHSSRFRIFRISKSKLFKTVVIILGAQETIPVIVFLLPPPQGGDCPFHPASYDPAWEGHP